MFDILRRGDILIVRWVDRLGRNYQDVTDTIREFMRRAVIVKTVINSVTFDGSNGHAQAEATKEAQKAHAKQNEGKYRGKKPSYTKEHVQTVQEMTGKSITELSKLTGLSRQAVYRIQGDPAAAIAALEAWSPN